MTLADQANHQLRGGEALGRAAQRHGGGPLGGVRHPNQNAKPGLQPANGRAPAADDVAEGAARDREGRLTRRAEARW